MDLLQLFALIALLIFIACNLPRTNKGNSNRVTVQSNQAHSLIVEEENPDREIDDEEMCNSGQHNFPENTTGKWVKCRNNCGARGRWRNGTVEVQWNS